MYVIACYTVSVLRVVGFSACFGVRVFVFCCVSCMLCLFVFFFQAEDGIRDRDVTGVQTCALPISCWRSPAAWWEAFSERGVGRGSGAVRGARPGARGGVPLVRVAGGRTARPAGRSEERRVGKEGRYCRVTEQ